MSKVKFKNGVELITIAVYGSTMTFQNANRDTLEFRIAEDKTNFEQLKALYTDSEALSEIEITEIVKYIDEEGNEVEKEEKSYHLHYTISVELSLKQINSESVWCMKIAQKSALEIAQDKQAEDINDTQLALMELADLIIAGGE